MALGGLVLSRLVLGRLVLGKLVLGRFVLGGSVPGRLGLCRTVLDRLALGRPVLEFNFGDGASGVVPPRPMHIEQSFDVLWNILDLYPSMIPGMHLLGASIIYAHRLCGLVVLPAGDEPSLAMARAECLRTLLS